MEMASEGQWSMPGLSVHLQQEEMTSPCSLLSTAAGIVGGEPRGQKSLDRASQRKWDLRNPCSLWVCPVDPADTAGPPFSPVSSSSAHCLGP